MRETLIPGQSKGSVNTSIVSPVTSWNTENKTAPAQPCAGAVYFLEKFFLQYLAKIRIIETYKKQTRFLFLLPLGALAVKGKKKDSLHAAKGRGAAYIGTNQAAFLLLRKVKKNRRGLAELNAAAIGANKKKIVG